MTTDEANPWDQPGAFGATVPKPDKQPRQRKAREAKPPAEPAAPKVRKPREVKEKTAPTVPEMVKVSLKLYAQMVAGDDAKLFLKLHSLLSTAPKGSRGKLLDELSKVLG